MSFNSSSSLPSLHIINVVTGDAPRAQRQGPRHGAPAAPLRHRGQAPQREPRPVRGGQVHGAGRRGGDRGPRRGGGRGQGIGGAGSVETVFPPQMQ